MSSRYRIICLSHTPALEVEEGWTSLGDAAEALATGCGSAEPHRVCDVVIGEYSYPLVDLHCPPGRHGHRWVNSVDVRKLRSTLDRLSRGWWTAEYREARLWCMRNPCWSVDRLTALAPLLLSEER